MQPPGWRGTAARQTHLPAESDERAQTNSAMNNTRVVLVTETTRRPNNPYNQTQTTPVLQRLTTRQSQAPGVAQTGVPALQLRGFHIGNVCLCL